MSQTLMEMMLYYWPKLVAALYFAFLNTWIVLRFYGRKGAAKNFLAFFFVSSAFLSIPAELIFTKAYYAAMHLLQYADPDAAVYIIWNTLADYMMVFLGVLLYKNISKQKLAPAAVVYLEFACIERVCMVLSVDALSFLVIYTVIQVFIFFVMRPEVEYVTQTDTIRFDRMVLYMCGLLFILDSMYSAYYLFPELGTNVINAPTVLWIDATTIIASACTLGYYKLSIREARLVQSRMAWMEKVQEGQENIIQTFAELSEAKSGETGQHVRRVAEYCKLLAMQLGVDEKETECIRIASMMHDVGKLMIPREIIEKPGKLTAEEYDIVKKHTSYGDKLLSNSDGHIMQMARVIAYQHHERWDGKGYPQGLAGDAINFYAQIASVADVYDALTNKRSYKEAWTSEEAREYILHEKGSQFSPKIVEAFEEIYGEIEKIRDRFQDA
ncbi:MAG: HD domain-containing protein [Lachnospiraceae bacterium]|nr:HD domain-containing protein [Lachnospiraceae bacterium]